MTKPSTTEASPSPTSIPPSKAKARADASQPFSGRPTTVRFPTDLQKKLAVAAKITGMSLSELMREGAEYVVDRYVGTDDAAVAARIEAAAEASAEQMRELYGLSK